MKTEELYDVLIIGGSYAGLAAAMSLGRSLKKTLVIDSGLPCNRQTPYSHNFLTQDGKTPKEISALARQQVGHYDTVHFHQGVALTGEKNEDHFQVSTGDGKTFFAKKLILAAGIEDQMPDIPGFTDCWGISVIHCPYCHGYEYRNQPTGIFANGEHAFHLAGLVNNLSPELTIFSNGPADFSAEQRHTLQGRNIRIVETTLSALEHQDGHLQQLKLHDGQVVELKALYAAIPFKQHSTIGETLGCALTELGLISVDAFQKTTVPGVFACGDNSSPMRAVANAVATGTLAGAMANRELTFEKF
jgi:thioredoxin reductase